MENKENEGFLLKLFIFVFPLEQCENDIGKH